MRRHAGFDHSYLFLSSLMEDRVRFHAKHVPARNGVSTNVLIPWAVVGAPTPKATPPGALS